MHHIFLCAVNDIPCGAATEPDLDQMDCIWMPLTEADAFESLHPKAIRGKLAALAKAESCEFLGFEFISD